MILVYSQVWNPILDFTTLLLQIYPYSLEHCFSDTFMGSYSFTSEMRLSPHTTRIAINRKAVKSIGEDLEKLEP